jgi:plasmid stabilization system protein ParE
MKRRIQILDAAKPDFRDIQRYVITRFGETVWQEVNQEFKTTLRDIGEHPESGMPLEELRALGLPHFRQRLVRHTQVIYEFDDQTVLVHLFIHTRRHFRTHLQQRVLRA